MDYLLRIHIHLLLVATVLFAILFAAGPGITQEPANFEEAFKKGIELYQGKKFPEAIAEFQHAVDFQPRSVSAITNLALAEFEAGHKPIAVALLRKAIALDPDFSTPEAALKFILPQLEIHEIPHEIQLRETLRNQFLVPVPWPAYMSIAIICLFSGGWLLLGYIGGRRRAFKNELPMPPFPGIGTIFLLGFILTAFLSAAKFFDYQIPRGTIVADKITVMSAPQLKSVPLFDLYGGHEVIIEKVAPADASDSSEKKEQWVQITYPGALSGWIPSSAIYPTSGKAL